MRTKRIEIPIYYGYLIIVVSDNFTAVAKKYKIQESVEHFGAFFYNFRNKNGIMEFMVCVPENVSNHLIAHEVVHIVNGIFIEKGIQLDRHNDEPQAYLTAWIFNEIEKFL